MTVPTPTSSTHAAGSAGAGRGKGTHAASAPRRLRRRSATSRPKWPMSGSVGTRRSSVRSPRLTMPPHWSRGNEHGQLALGSIADRVDVGNPRVRYGVHGLRAASSSASTGRARSPLPACVRDRHHRDHDAGTALHATEAAIWAAAYLWLGALGSPEAATPLLCRFDGHARRVGGHVATPLADAGRPRGRRWYAAVRDQHGLHLHRDAVLLSGPKTHGRLMATVGETRDHARHPNRVFQSERSSEGARRTASVRPMPLWPTLAHAIDGRPTSPADHEAEAWGR